MKLSRHYRRILQASALCAVFYVQSVAHAEDVSAPAILEWFEASYDTMERRSADMFLAGYGAVWTPPPGRADTSNFSVGYDVYDRFDLGNASHPTLYGTEVGLKHVANLLHRFDGRLHIDAVLNHNAYSDNDYVNPQFNNFLQAGGYPGFVLQDPDGGTDPAGVPGTFGDFHDPNAFGHINGQLSELLDIDHGKVIQLIRQPVAAGNPVNIPAGVTPYFGRLANLPDPNNARFYPDTDLPGATYFDPKTNSNVTVYPYNLANPLAGNAVAESATGLLRRNLQWLVQEIGVDGFRIDAAKHMEIFALNQFDAAVYRANPRPLLDGSVDQVFMYGEVVPGDGQNGQSLQDFLYGYIRKDIDPNSPNTIGGNRDVLDFALREGLNYNLQNSGIGNDWRNLVNSGMDVRDDGFHNGSAGVTFVSNHDGGGAEMTNVAHAYLLTQPGQAIVYYNADQFDAPNRDFPVDGRGDALGNYGDTITELVNIRNTHGRGDYRERWLEKDYFAMERSGNILVVLDNRNDAGVSSVKTMDVDLPVGTHLVELTGNAAAYNATSPPQALQEVLTVQNIGGASKVDVRFLHNDGQDKGYLIYGLQTPQSAAGLLITNASGVLAGGNPSPSDLIANATTRLSDLQVVTANQIDIRLETQAVTLSDGFRDLDADGDNAVLRVNNGMDTNESGQIDYTTPGSVVYGFEEFSSGNKSPGFGSPTGNGWYQESIDATSLPEGYNFITVRAFRHRNDGGPAVFSDFKQVVYLDRVAPESEIASFAPYGTDPEDLDLIVASVDQTADTVHVFLDVGAAHSDSEILSWVNDSNKTSRVDGGQFKYAYQDVGEGNHVATVVMVEPTGNFTIRRFVGLSPDTNHGAGFGDLNFNGQVRTGDLAGFNNGSFEDVLYSQNTLFNAAADLDGNGLVNNLDLFALGPHLASTGTSPTILNSFDAVLLRRGDINADSLTNVADVAALYGAFGGDAWLPDLNVDGIVNTLDVQTLITNIFQTVNGDFDLDGDVDGQDFLAWQRNVGTPGRYDQGDADLNGVIDGADLAIWQNAYATTRLTDLQAAAQAVPEPSAWVLGVMSGLLVFVGRNKPCAVPASR